MIEREQQGEIAVLRLTHGKVNALDLELSRAITARLAEELERPTRAVILTGQGNAFSAGVDLLRVLDGGADYVREFMPAFIQAATAIFTFPKPLVTAVNGHAIAGGCLLACAADRRIMVTEGAKIGVPELAVGVPFPSIALEILRFTTSSTTAQRLVFDGKIVSPEVALRAGLIDETIPADRLLDRALSASEKMASLPAAAFAVSKRQIRAPFVERIGGDEEVTEIWCRPETHAAIRSYVEKTFKKS